MCDPGGFKSCVHPPPTTTPTPSTLATHPVDEDVSWQSGVGLLQAAEAVHHPAVVKGQRDLCQTASCSTEQDFKERRGLNTGSVFSFFRGTQKVFDSE